MKPQQPFACFMLSGLLLVMVSAVFSTAQAAEAHIRDFRFECRTPDGKRLKPKFGDVDGVFFTDLPGQRDACIAAVDRMIATCHENTSFTSNTRNREYAGCLPIFRTQARDCAAFFRNERHKCGAGGSGSASLRNGGAAPDLWRDEGSTGGDSVWDPPASEEADSGDQTQAATWTPPAPAADDGGETDRDVSSYATALSEVLGDAPQPEAAQDDYTGALVALERQRATEREAEARREAEREAEARREAEREAEARREAERQAVLRAERRALRERRERAERERRLAETLEAQRREKESHRRLRESVQQTVQRSQDFLEAQRREAERQRRQRCASVIRRAKQYEAEIREAEKSMNVEAANAILRKVEALVEAHPNC